MSGQCPTCGSVLGFGASIPLAAQPRAVSENCLPFTNEVIDKMQDVMADHGFTVPVRVISDAFRTTLVVLLTAAPSPGDPHA